jgi:hypothetical protein
MSDRTDTAELVKHLTTRAIIAVGFNDDGLTAILKMAADAIERLEAEKLAAYQQGQRDMQIRAVGALAKEDYLFAITLVQALPIKGETK